MSKTNIFQNPATEIPKSDPRIVRVPFDQQDLGARKSHLRNAGPIKNDMNIEHVKG